VAVKPNEGFGLTLTNAFAAESPTAVITYDADGRVAALAWTPAQPKLTWRAKVLDQAFVLKTVRLVLSGNVVAYRLGQASGDPAPPDFHGTIPADASPVAVAAPTTFPSLLLPSPVVSAATRVAAETLELAPTVLGLPGKLDARTDFTLSLALDQQTFRDYLARAKPIGSVDVSLGLVDDGGVTLPAGAGPALFKGRFTVK
jgi:hypothetical protein